MVNEENIYRLCYQPHPNTMIMLIQYCVNKNLASSIQKYIELKDLGYCNSDILQTMINVLKLISIDENIRINYIKILADTYLNVNDGIDTDLQMYSCISKMIRYMYDLSEQTK
jgi:replication factor C subunit 2/4